MHAAEAREMLSWRYDPPYEMYTIEPEDIEAEVAYQTNPANHYFSIRHDDELVGHCVFHAEARVPGGDYSEDALDVGIGMRPDWTGQGRGAAITAAVLAFAQERYQPQQFRATVAAWNERAQRVCIQNGFQVESRFAHPETGMAFVILLRSPGSQRS
ncbi:MAG: GNAT family N-acetyltransferase [Anaerolineae bacterium]|nr:GNAT family N-acetyltransferase [Anaerolineae bacterium]